MDTKVCRRCRQEFPATLEYFYKAGNNRVGLRAICKKCNNKESTPGKSRNYKYTGVINTTKRVRNPTLMRLYAIQRDYKIDPSFVIDLMDEQEGCCAICGNSLVTPESERNFCIDHCHSTGEVRGLLCGKCNIAIGLFGDSVYNLSKAIEYLTKD